MFTGIVEALGTVVAVRTSAEDRDLELSCAALAPRLTLGASIALDGVCQTVTRIDGERFWVHAIAETLRVTTLGDRQPGDELNLELPVAAGAPMGGHFVQGHVDGVAKVSEIAPLGQSIRMRFTAPPALVAQLVPKGSVAIDGISLTVGSELGDERFEVHLIPHTLEVTTLGRRKPGDSVNLETDVLGKYLLRYLGRESGGAGISWDDLRRTGFDGPWTGENR